MRAELGLLSVICCMLAGVMFFGVGHHDAGLFILGIAVLFAQWRAACRRSDERAEIERSRPMTGFDVSRN